jgi:hypothetical protein
MYDPNLSHCSGIRPFELCLSRLAAEPETGPEMLDMIVQV